MKRTSIEAIGLVLATLNLDDAYPAQRELLREVLDDVKQSQEAVAQEREACARVLDEMADQMATDMEPSTAIAWVRNRAAFIRARGNAIDKLELVGEKPAAYICEFYADPGYPFLSFEPIESGTNIPLYKWKEKKA